MAPGTWGPHWGSGTPASPALIPAQTTQGNLSDLAIGELGSTRLLPRGRTSHHQRDSCRGDRTPSPRAATGQDSGGRLSGGSGSAGGLWPTAVRGGASAGRPRLAARPSRCTAVPDTGRRPGHRHVSGRRPQPSRPRPGRPRSPAVAPHSHGAPAPRPRRLGAPGRPVPVPDHGPAAAARPGRFPDSQRPPPAGPAPPGARGVTRASPAARGQWRAPSRPPAPRPPPTARGQWRELRGRPGTEPRPSARGQWREPPPPSPAPAPPGGLRKVRLPRAANSVSAPGRRGGAGPRGAQRPRPVLWRPPAPRARRGARPPPRARWTVTGHSRDSAEMFNNNKKGC